MSQDLQAILSHKESMLPLSGRFLILRNHGPAILLIYKYTPIAHVNHRLDREDHAGHKQHSCSLPAKMKDLRLLVESEPDTVTTQVAHDGITILLGMTLDRVTDIADITERMSGRGPNLKTLLGDLNQPTLLGRDITDHEHP